MREEEGSLEAKIKRNMAYSDISSVTANGLYLAFTHASDTIYRLPCFYRTREVNGKRAFLSDLMLGS